MHKSGIARLKATDSFIRGLSAELLRKVLERGGHRLFKRGVRTHGQQELIDRHVVGERLRDAADHVARMLAHELRAEKLACFGVGDELHKAAARVGDERLGVVEHDVFADLDGDARLLGLGLGEADDRDLRTAVDAARHDGHGCVIFPSVEQVDAGDALRGRHMGELNFGRDVADGVDVGDARLVALVHGDAAAVHLDRNAIREQAVAVRAAADGAEHGLAGDGLALFLAGEVDGDILTRLLDALDHRVREDLHALLFEDEREALAELLVHVGQQAIHAFDDGHFTAEVCVKRRKLDADDAAADDDDGAVQVVAPLKQLVGGHRELKSGNRRAGRDGAGGDENIVAGVVVGTALGVRHADSAGCGDERRAAQKVDLCGLEKRFNAGGQLLRNFALVGKNLRHVGADIVGVDAGVCAVLGVVEDLRRVQQRFRRDAAAV